MKGRNLKRLINETSTTTSHVLSPAAANPAKRVLELGDLTGLDYREGLELESSCGRPLS